MHRVSRQDRLCARNPALAARLEVPLPTGRGVANVDRDETAGAGGKAATWRQRRGRSCVLPGGFLNFSFFLFFFSFLVFLFPSFLPLFIYLFRPLGVWGLASEPTVPFCRPCLPVAAHRRYGVRVNTVREDLALTRYQDRVCASPRPDSRRDRSLVPVADNYLRAASRFLVQKSRQDLARDSITGIRRYWVRDRETKEP